MTSNMMTVDAKLALFALHGIVANKVYSSRHTWLLYKEGQGIPRLRFGKTGAIRGEAWFLQTHEVFLTDKTINPAHIPKWVLRELSNEQLFNFLSLI